MTDYRIRFTPVSPLSGPDPLVAHPGTIKNNQPKALEILTRYQQDPTTEFWLEARETKADEWRRVE